MNPSKNGYSFLFVISFSKVFDLRRVNFWKTSFLDVGVIHGNYGSYTFLCEFSAVYFACNLILDLFSR